MGSRTWARRRLTSTVLGLLVVLGMLGLAGCGGSSGGSAGGSTGGSASCAAVLESDGATYLGSGGLDRDPELTGRTVSAVIPGCDDTGGQGRADPATRVEAAVLADVDPATAVYLDGAVYVRDGRELPAWTRRWFRPQPCTAAGPFEVTGDWLGVSSPREVRSDGDLRPPYRLEVHLTAGPARYVGATVHLRASATTDPTLTSADVRTSLWEGGQVVATVRCSQGRYDALALRSLPPAP